MSNDTRARMVHTTAKLLQRQGYHGTGLNQIVAVADAPKGSIYFHFPGGKEQLTAEAIAHSASYLDRVMDKQPSTSAVVAIDSYLAGAAQRLERTEFREGCPIATVALDVGASSVEIADACSAAFNRIIERIAAWLEAEGVETAAAHDSAFLVLTALEGALMLAKVKRSVEPITRLREALPDLIGSPG
ncbi:MAG: TetR/AcrR family transcriptional regulator [Ilumatobacteraceae bacterium]